VNVKDFHWFQMVLSGQLGKLKPECYIIAKGLVYDNKLIFFSFFVPLLQEQFTGKRCGALLEKENHFCLIF
jgi:hypothetical protein